MKIGVVVDNDFVNDGRVSKEVSILKEYYNVSILCLSSHKNGDSQNDKLDVIYLNKFAYRILFGLSSWLPVYKWIWEYRIRKFIENNELEILHVHDLYMVESAAPAIASFKQDIKLIVDLHENFPASIVTQGWTKGYLRRILSRPHLWAIKEKELLKQVDRIIALSEDYKQDLVQRYTFLSADNIFVFPNIIDFKRFSGFKINEHKTRDDRITFLYFGVVGERRGIFDTLEVFERALKIHKNILLRIIGPVDRADRKKFNWWLEKETLIDSLEYIPWIPLDELPTELNRVDVCLAPFHNNDQHNSGVANKIFQYMYAEKALIVSDCKPQKDLILEAKCGLVFASSQNYLGCILKLISDPLLRSSLSQAGKKFLHKHYDTESHSNQLLAVYNSFSTSNN